MSARGKDARPRAGNAGLIASVMIAIAGAVLGALAAFVGEFGAAATASRIVVTDQPSALVLQDKTPRAEIVRRVLESEPPARLEAPSLVSPSAPRPKIVIVLDDIGVDPDAAERALRLPGPVTYSVLPYAANAGALVDRAIEAGREVFLHLPMEPIGDSDPGPYALRTDMSGAEFIRALEWNLSQFGGYAGVNNHMGSKFTADEAAMKTLLAYLKERGVLFLDSVTTGSTAAGRAGVQVGAEVIQRDVFLDATPNDSDEVRRQLHLVERIAIETGYAVAIGHPRAETLEALGPWLTTAQARGFDLTTVTAIAAPEPLQVMTAAPDLRL
ncbi:MAG: divergent polysaccharide deacetylase family protein [Pseudomonadota bacterium]